MLLGLACGSDEPAPDAAPASGSGGGAASPVVAPSPTSPAEPQPAEAASAPPTPTPEPTPVPSATPTATPTPLPPLQRLEAEQVARGFDQPVFVTGAPGTDALFVVEREGIVRVVESGVVREEPFLDLRSRLNSSSIEQGLLGLAFHPTYADTGRLFAHWTAVDGASTVAEVIADGPTEALDAEPATILTVAQPGERHNAGMLAFDPDGVLYIALGDGGSGGSTAQDTTSLLGSILRIDVDSGTPYGIPPGNPFDDEIWVYGLRNPWRFSIDPVERLVYIGDVGQDTFEEINVVALDGAGTNFGWLPMEGSICFQGGCTREDFTPPVVEYTHEDGCSVTGGYVYRGAAIPELDGHYFYADWCSGLVRSFRYADGEAADEADWTDQLGELGEVTSFGIDNAGELYATNWDGELHRIVPVR